MSETVDIELPGLGEPITLSDRAAKRIAEIMSGEAEGTMLRVAVNGGGCSGFQYAFTLDDTRQDDDLVLEKNGAIVLIGQAFKINNPNATANCGCGTSFSI